MPDLQSELRKVTGQSQHSSKLKVIWEYIRDNPGITNKKLLLHFKPAFPAIATSRTVYDLLARGMVTTEKRAMPHSARPVNHFFVNLRLRSGYEEWPRPLKPKEVQPEAKPVKELPAPQPVAVPVLQTVQQPTNIDGLVSKLLDADLDMLVDHLPVRFAKQLHSKLNELFKD